MSKTDLLGAWESVEVTLAGGATTLDLQPEDKFTLEHHDVALGWRTTVKGNWELSGGQLILNAKERLHDGEPVAVGEKQKEALAVTREAGGWILGDAPRLKKMPKKAQHPQ